MKLNVKQLDIAKHTGLSTATVSRVLNNHPSIKPSTRKAVLDSMQRLGFANAGAAGSGAGASCSTVYVAVCPLGEQSDPMGMNYYSQVMERIRAEVRDRDVKLETVILGGAEKDFSFCEKADGVLLVGFPDDDTIRHLQESGIPFVVSGRTGKPMARPCCLVTSDKFHDGVCLAEYLADKGYRRIGLMMPRIDWLCREGLVCGLNRRGIELCPSHVQLVADTSLVTYVEPVHRLLESPGGLPEVVAFASPDPADLFEQMLRLKGLRCPEDVAVVAFTDYDNGPARPYLSDVRYDTGKMSAVAVGWLMRKVAGDDSQDGCTVVVPAIFPDP